MAKMGKPTKQDILDTLAECAALDPGSPAAARAASILQAYEKPAPKPLGRPRGRVRVYPENPTAQRIRALGPGTCFMTLEEIGQRVGVTRERVRQIYIERGWPKPGPAARRREAIQKYFLEHPEDLLPVRMGGRPHDEIEARMGHSFTNADLEALGLPLRGTIMNSEPFKPGARNAHENKINEWIPCWACGASFAWTRGHESSFKQFTKHPTTAFGGRRKFKVCSSACGVRFREMGFTREAALEYAKERGWA